MSVRSGLVGMGVGAAFMIAGGICVHEGYGGLEQLNAEQGCLKPEFAEQPMCADRVITPQVIDLQGRKASLNFFLGALGLVGGTTGVFLSYVEFEQSDNRKIEQAATQAVAEAHDQAPA